MTDLANRKGTGVFDIGLDNSYDFLSEEYAELFESSRATAFQNPLWLDRVYRNLAPQLNADAVVVAVRRRDNGRLAMLLPLLRRRHGALRVIEFADLQVSDYAAPVADDAVFTQIASDRQAREKIRALLKPYDLLRIQKIGETAQPLEQLLGVRRRASMGVSAHAVGLQAPYAQWEAEKISASYRKELDKKRRQLNRKGAVRFECSHDLEFIKSTFHSMREYRKERFNGGDLLQQPRYFDFYLDMALQGKDSGFCRTYTLSIDERPIGGVWGLFHRRQFLVLLLRLRSRHLQESIDRRSDVHRCRARLHRATGYPPRLHDRRRILQAIVRHSAVRHVDDLGCRHAARRGRELRGGKRAVGREGCQGSPEQAGRCNGGVRERRVAAAAARIHLSMKWLVGPAPDQVRESLAARPLCIVVVMGAHKGRPYTAA